MSARYKHDSLTFAPEDPDLLPIPVRETTPLPVAIMSGGGGGPGGSVTVIGSVEITNEVGSPIPVSITGSIPVTIASAIEITNDAGNPIPVNGTVAVSNFPAAPADPATATLQGTANLALASLVTQTDNIEPLLTTIDADTSVLASVVRAEDSPHTDGDLGLVILAQRRDSDTPSVGSDGDYTTLKMDEAGRLKVAVQPGAQAAVVGNIAANGGIVWLNTARTSNLTLSMRVPSAVAGHNCTFEVSNNTTNGTDGAWYGMQAIRSNANTVELTTGALAATPAYGWELSVNGWDAFRVRANAHTSGSAEWTIKPAPFATEPIPAAQVSGTQPISGTVAANATLVASTVRAGFVAGAGIWYDDSSTNLAANATFTGTARDLTVTATATAMANAATYAKEMRLSAESDVTGTLWLETSRDNVNWRRVKSVATTAVAGGGFFAEIVHRPSWRYARVGYTNGAGAQARFTLNSLLVAV